MNKLEFNIAGPCIPSEHYMLDPMRGISDELMELIDGKKYFVIHAARQTGKTTLLKELVRQINAKGTYYAVYCTLECTFWFSEPEKGIPAIVYTIKSAIEESGAPKGFAAKADFSDISNVIRLSFIDYCGQLDKPLVVFFDEADGLSEGTLITFLKQFRHGYINRSDTPFVHSVALVGMLNLRDYKVHIRPDSETMGGTSPFNIITESLNLRNFIKEEVAELYAQHTSATGQVFEPRMIEYAYEQTQGQPWLVNAIARECVEKILKKDYTIPITQALAEQAIQNIVRDRRTHIESMVDKLAKTRVRNVIVPLIMNEELPDKHSSDYLYTKDLGLIRETENGKVEPANPIYAEMITRALNSGVQESIQNTHKDYIIPRYLKDGTFDMDFLIRDFQEYWRENSEIWIDRYKKNYYKYDEAAPHLVIQAFLQRVVNGGGQLIREYAANTKRVDLCIVYNGQKYPIELKILQNERSREASLKQMLEYMDSLGSDAGWLVVFDRDMEKNWDEKIYMKEETVNGKKIVVAGC